MKIECPECGRLTTILASGLLRGHATPEQMKVAPAPGYPRPWCVASGRQVGVGASAQPAGDSVRLGPAPKPTVRTHSIRQHGFYGGDLALVCDDDPSEPNVQLRWRAHEGGGVQIDMDYDEAMKLRDALTRALREKPDWML